MESSRAKIVEEKMLYLLEVQKNKKTERNNLLRCKKTEFSKVKQSLKAFRAHIFLPLTSPCWIFIILILNCHKELEWKTFFFFFFLNMFLRRADRFIIDCLSLLCKTDVDCAHNYEISRELELKISLGNLNSIYMA